MLVSEPVTHVGGSCDNAVCGDILRFNTPCNRIVLVFLYSCKPLWSPPDFPIATCGDMEVCWSSGKPLLSSQNALYAPFLLFPWLAHTPWSAVRWWPLTTWTFEHFQEETSVTFKIRCTLHTSIQTKGMMSLSLMVVYLFKVFVITDKARAGGSSRRCRCYQRPRAKAWGDWSLSHTRCSGGENYFYNVDFYERNKFE
jgi:hypothetical protein